MHQVLADIVGPVQVGNVVVELVTEVVFAVVVDQAIRIIEQADAVVDVKGRFLVRYFPTGDFALQQKGR
jgi:hypothetical protein